MMDWKNLLSYSRPGEKNTSQNQNRSRFEQDYDRIIFSQPFRRLQDKTQVFPLPEDDFVHTRLTHSLEVSSVGRSMGKIAGEWIIKEYHLNAINDQDIGAIVGAASLAHDLGNPPFGHSGEDCISGFYLKNPQAQKFQNLMATQEWIDLTHFEGNAQGFRILNSNLYGGLKLTHATLGAFTKYPLSSSAEKAIERKSQKKYGYYQSDAQLFEEVAGTLGLLQLNRNTWTRHPLTFLVEAADDICYHIIDLEDGCRLGLVDFETTKELLRPIIGDRYSEEKLEKIPTLNEKLGSLRALAINALIVECTQLFIEKESEILKGQFDVALTDSIPSAGALKQIISLSIKNIYRSKLVLEKETGGFRIIESLLENFTEAAFFHVQGKLQGSLKPIFFLIPEIYRHHLTKDKSLYQTLQLINDFISGLTDTHAVKLYKTLNGIDII